MHTATWLSFYDELEKIAGLGAGAADIAGLGMLAAPTIQKMRGKPMSEKGKDRAELAGLGVLGGSVVAEHSKELKSAAKSGFSKLKGMASKFKKASPSMSAMMKMHGMADAAKAAAKAAAKGAKGTAKAVGSLTNNAARAPMLQSFMASGGHAFKANPNRALSL